MNQETGPLHGINVLVTRPDHQSEFLADNIRKMDGIPIIFPVLTISDIQDKKPLEALIKQLDTFDLAIFVSPNAVHKAMPLMQSHHSLSWPVKFAAVGKGSTAALKTYGVEQVITPEIRFDSEALLEHAALQQVSGKRVVIFRGNGGRALLGDTLKHRGALVEYATCYLRSKPDVDPSKLLSDWSQGKIHAVIITSSEGLQNLFDIIGLHGQQLLKITPVFTAHVRIAQKARESGVKTVIEATSAGDRGLLLAMQDYFVRIKIAD